jgi:AraC-like DNA-binding protein
MKSANNVTFLRDPHLQGVEFAQVRESDHCFPNHCHDYYIFGVMETGAAYCLGKGRDHSIVTSGKIWMLNPGQVHSGMPAANTTMTYCQLNISVDWMHRAAAELHPSDPGLPNLPSVVADVPHVAAAIPVLHRMIAEGMEPLAKQSAAIAVASRLLQAVGPFKTMRTSCREPGATRRARDYLVAHPETRVSLDELALAAGLSRFHLLRVFKKSTGLTPHQFHLQVRLDRAKSLLLQGESLTGTALATGFSDQSHFTNSFKRFVGATPRQYQAF